MADAGPTGTKDLLSKFQKDYGEGIGGVGLKLPDAERIPTGLFPFDLATGGGLPRGRVTTVFGPESSCKTNIVLKAIAAHQTLWPELNCVFIDVETSFDPEWAATLGVDVNKLILIRPDYAEQVVNMTESFLHAYDIGLVAIDSLAAMVTAKELDDDAEKANVGGNGLVVGKLVRKTTHALGQAQKQGRLPTLVYINQIRNKIGVMYGSPETMPGGDAPKFQNSLLVRVYGKNELDAKISKVMPVTKEVQFVIKKWKVPIVAASGKFTMVTYPHKGLKAGDTDDWNTISHYLSHFGQLGKKEKGQGWVMLGDEYKTLTECKARVYEDLEFGRELRKALIERVMSDGLDALTEEV